MNAILSRRLRPLYAAAFFQSFVLWYAIEKLFMTSIGFSNADIGFMVAVYSAVMLAVDIPSGILADRWSRKGVLVLASVALIGSAVVGGFSHSVATYVSSAVLWGIFFACYSGMYESLVYDTLLDEKQPASLYSKIYGRLQIAESIGLILSSLAGGFLGSRYSLRTTFFLTIPFVVGAMVSLWLFREPKLHKQNAASDLFGQVRETFRTVLRNPSTLPLVTALLLKAVVLFMFFEFDQLWLIALDMPTQYYGITNALILASIGIGGWGAQHVHIEHVGRSFSLLILLLIGSFTLTFTHNIPLVIAAQATVATTLVALGISLMNRLHGLLPSHVRASAVSTTSTLGRAVLVPVALLFGYIAEQTSVFQAAYILVVLSFILSFFVLLSLGQKARLSHHSRP